MSNDRNQEAGSVGAGSVVAERWTTRLESPLVALQGKHARWEARPAAGLSLTEQPFLELVNLRGNAQAPAFVDALNGVVGCSIPVAPNTFVEGTTHRILWLGPDEWLAQSKLPQSKSCVPDLLTALAGLFASAVDVGSGYTVIRISGVRAQEILARGCPLDLHPTAFKVGQCAQSLFFKASILIAAVELNTFDIIVRRSFAEYVVHMLVDAAETMF
ncbi:sarcosine oxidase subunit gamma family protein [Paraburkholderia xenovorans]|uniref:sarcosine oxidase subunit gamma n=1 Tax=Paraburkholderia xenovorans TaxID=36873 RepID=UPI0038BE03A7